MFGLLLPRGLLFLLNTKSLVLWDQQGIQHTPWQRGRARWRWDQLTCDLKGEPTSPDGGDEKISHESILNCAWHTASAQETNCCSYCPLGPSVPSSYHRQSTVSNVLVTHRATSANPGLWPHFPDSQQIQGTHVILSICCPQSLGQGPGADPI